MTASLLNLFRLRIYQKEIRNQEGGRDQGVHRFQFEGNTSQKGRSSIRCLKFPKISRSWASVSTHPFPMCSNTSFTWS